MSQKNQQPADARYYDAILSPVITEKSTAALEDNKYIFKVANDAAKPLIKKAVEHIFGVTVQSVNTISIEGKRKRFRGVAGKRSDVKKAVVTLKEGDYIDLTARV